MNDNFTGKYLQAQVVMTEYGTKIRLVRIPLIWNEGLPDVPRLIECNGWYAYLVDTNPLTYKSIGPPISVEIAK